MRLTRAAAAEDDGRQVVWTVGRQHPASVVLKDEDWELYASRQHASFVFDVPSSRFSLVALPDATNGTFVNDVKLTPRQHVVLRDGDVVSFAGKASDSVGRYTKRNNPWAFAFYGRASVTDITIELRPQETQAERSVVPPSAVAVNAALAEAPATGVVPMPQPAALLQSPLPPPSSAGAGEHGAAVTPVPVFDPSAAGAIITCPTSPPPDGKQPCATAAANTVLRPESQKQQALAHFPAVDACCAPAAAVAPSTGGQQPLRSSDGADAFTSPPFTAGPATALRSEQDRHNLPAPATSPGVALQARFDAAAAGDLAAARVSSHDRSQPAAEPSQPAKDVAPVAPALSAPPAQSQGDAPGEPHDLQAAGEAAEAQPQPLLSLHAAASAAAAPECVAVASAAASAHLEEPSQPQPAFSSASAAAASLPAAPAADAPDAAAEAAPVASGETSPAPPNSISAAGADEMMAAAEVVVVEEEDCSSDGGAQQDAEGGPAASQQEDEMCAPEAQCADDEGADAWGSTAAADGEPVAAPPDGKPAEEVLPPDAQLAAEPAAADEEMREAHGLGGEKQGCDDEAAPSCSDPAVLEAQIVVVMSPLQPLLSNSATPPGADAVADAGAAAPAASALPSPAAPDAAAPAPAEAVAVEALLQLESAHASELEMTVAAAPQLAAGSSEGPAHGGPGICHKRRRDEAEAADVPGAEGEDAAAGAAGSAAAAAAVEHGPDSKSTPPRPAPVGEQAALAFSAEEGEAGDDAAPAAKLICRSPSPAVAPPPAADGEEADAAMLSEDAFAAEARSFLEQQEQHHLAQDSPETIVPKENGGQAATLPTPAPLLPLVQPPQLVLHAQAVPPKPAVHAETAAPDAPQSNDSELFVTQSTDGEEGGGVAPMAVDGSAAAAAGTAGSAVPEGSAPPQQPQDDAQVGTLEPVTEPAPQPQAGEGAAGDEGAAARPAGEMKIEQPGLPEPASDNACAAPISAVGSPTNTSAIPPPPPHETAAGPPSTTEAVLQWLVSADSAQLGSVLGRLAHTLRLRVAAEEQQQPQLEALSAALAALGGGGVSAAAADDEPDGNSIAVLGAPKEERIASAADDASAHSAAVVFLPAPEPAAEAMEVGRQEERTPAAAAGFLGAMSNSNHQGRSCTLA